MKGDVHQEIKYKQLQKNAREIKDDKVLVSFLLLEELRRVADLVLNPYNAMPAKAMFICVWTLSMHVCEFTTMGTKELGHL